MWRMLRAVATMATRYVERHGAPHVLVNNAGYAVYRSFEEMDARRNRPVDSGELFWRLLRHQGVSRVDGGSRPRAHRHDGLHRRPLAHDALRDLQCRQARDGRMGRDAEGRGRPARHRRARGLSGARETRRSSITIRSSSGRRDPKRNSLCRWNRSREATIEAVERGRFLTYRPRTYRFVVWAAQSLSVFSRPWLQRLMRARVPTLRCREAGEPGPVPMHVTSRTGQCRARFATPVAGSCARSRRRPISDAVDAASSFSIRCRPPATLSPTLKPSIREASTPSMCGRGR